MKKFFLLQYIAFAVMPGAVCTFMLGIALILFQAENLFIIMGIVYGIFLVFNLWLTNWMVKNSAYYRLKPH